MARFSGTQAAGYLLTGAAIGAAIALLYAPKTGVQARRDIRKFSKKTIDRLDDFQDEVREQVTDWVDVGKKFSTESYEQVMEVFDNAKKVVEDGKTKLQRMIKTA